MKLKRLYIEDVDAVIICKLWVQLIYLHFQYIGSYASFLYFEKINKK